VVLRREEAGRKEIKEQTKRMLNVAGIEVAILRRWVAQDNISCSVDSFASDHLAGSGGRATGYKLAWQQQP